MSLLPPTYSEVAERMPTLTRSSGDPEIIGTTGVDDTTSGDSVEDIDQVKAQHVEPAFALRLIAKGRATGNRPALWTRSLTEGNLFRLGNFIHRHAGKVLVAGLILLCICCLGLRNIHFENHLDKLWVEERGRISNEEEYMQRIHGSERGASPLILLQTPDKSSNASLLSSQALLLHLKAALVATELEIEIFKTSWTLKDICHKVNFPNFDETIPAISPALDQLYPCSIVTPLDCFWEGAKLLDPQTAVMIPGYEERLLWSTLNPQDLMAALNGSRHVDSSSDDVSRVTYDAKPFAAFLKKADVRGGYVEKACLNPDDPDCPTSAINYKNKKVPDIAKVVSGGCSGISHKYMKWNEQLLFGQVKKNRAEEIYSVSAMQTIFHITTAKELYESLKGHMKTSEDAIDTDWSEEAAAIVIQTWQSKVAEEVARALRNEDAKETITVYSAGNLQRIVETYSEFSVPRLAIGFSGVVLYVCIALKRWSDPVNSYSGLGFAGTLLAGLSVAAGVSLSAFLRTDFNVLSTQIVPFLALGLNVFYVVQMVRTLSELVEEKVPPDNLCGECLKQNGLAIILSTIGASLAFFAGYAVPVPALRTFAIQMGILSALSCPAMLILFPAILSLDQRRRSARRLDLFCCYGRPVPVPEVRYSQSALITIGGPRARNAKLGCCTRSTRSGRRPGKACPCRGQSRIRCHDGQPTKLGPLDHRLMESGMLHYAGYDTGDLTGSTNSIFRGDVPTCCDDIQATCETVHVSQWLLRLYLRLITGTCTKFAVLLAFCLLLAGSAWGIAQIEDGLDLTDFIPKDTPEHRYLEASTKSFGWYSMQAVSKGPFEYQNNQQLLHAFHQAFQRVDPVVKMENDHLPMYWLARMRDWLKDLDATLEKEYNSDFYDRGGSFQANATADAILAFKLRAQTGKDDYDVEQVLRNRLVDRRGVINPKAFYYYLSAWVGNDELAYASTQAMLHPEPKRWIHEAHDSNFRIERSQTLDYAQFHFDLHGLRTTPQILKVLNQVRLISASFEKQGLPNFPSGVIFSFWEQYVTLKYHLLVSLIVLLIVFFVVISMALVNLWAAALAVLMTSVLVIEMAGLIGWMGIKLNAILAAIIIFSPGIALMFTLRICMLFLTGIGSKNGRVRYSLMTSLWPIVHGSAALFIGASMLAFTGFDFIFRYFFLVLTGQILLTTLNSLVLLPVFLSLVGPVPDLIPNDDPERVPTLTPEPPFSRSESRACVASMCAKNLQKDGYRVGASTVSLSTISEEDSISCQQIFLEPQVTVETTTSYPDSTNVSRSGSSQDKSTHEGGSAMSTFTTVVSTRAKVKVELYR